MKIALFGLFGAGNFGNDASLSTILQFLRRMVPQAEIVCVCHDPQSVSKEHQIETVPIEPSRGRLRVRRRSLWMRWIRGLVIRLPTELLVWCRTFWYLRKFQVLIVPGTGILDDFCESPLSMPYSLFRWCLAAKLAGTKVLFIGVGAGPIHNPLSRILMGTAARIADYRSYREQTSKDFMLGLNVGSTVDPVCPDIVFGLSPEGVGSSSYTDRDPHDALEVGVGIMTYHGWRGGSIEIYDAYIEKMAKFVAWLLEQHHRVRLLIGDMADVDAIESLLASVTKHHDMKCRDRLIVEPSCSFHDVMCQMAKVDMVVATRYHNIVCSLILAKPTISIGYAKKNDVLMAAMGLSEFCQHIEHLSVATLIEQFNYLASHRTEVTHYIQEQTCKSKSKVAAHFDAVFTKYLSKGACLS